MCGPARCKPTNGARQGPNLHTRLTTYVGPRASQVQGQRWDPTVLEQWAAAIATPCLHLAHMGLAGPHDIGTEFIRLVVKESQSMWLSHSRVREGPIKARARPGGTMAWALRELHLHQQVKQQGVPRATLN